MIQPDVESLSGEDLLSKGKQAFYAGEYENALTYLSKSCEKISQNEGDMSMTMVDPSFYYAKSLFMYGKLDDGLVNEVGEGTSNNKEGEVSDGKVEKCEINEDTKRSDDETIKETDDEPTNQTDDEPTNQTDDEPTNQTDDETTNENEDETTKDDNDETAPEDETKKSKSDCVDSKEKEENNDKNEEDNDEDENDVDIEEPSYFQLAFENIECAKVILKKKLKESNSDANIIKEVELKLADFCDLTGHIYTEDNNPTLALEEYTEGLNLREKHDNIRAVAESHLNLGLVHNHLYNLESSIKHYNECKRIFEDLNKSTDLKSDDRKSNQEIIDELNTKIEDIDIQRKEFQMLKRNVTTKLNLTNAPVNNINSLVRKRKKVPDNDGGIPTKVAKDA